MKLHSDILTVADLYEAAAMARAKSYDIEIDEAITQGSRSRKRGITFYCEAMHGPRSRPGRDGYAATWDAYGWLIAELFNRDPRAIIGYYKSPSHFLLQCKLEGEHRPEPTLFLDHLNTSV